MIDQWYGKKMHITLSRWVGYEFDSEWKPWRRRGMSVLGSDSESQNTDTNYVNTRRCQMFPLLISFCCNNNFIIS